MMTSIYNPKPIATYDGNTGRVKYSLSSPVYLGWSRLLEVIERLAVGISVNLYFIDGRYYVLLHHNKEHIGAIAIPQDDFPNVPIEDVTFLFKKMLRLE